MPSLLVQILVTHNLFASVWPSCRENTAINREGALVFIFAGMFFSLCILSRPWSSNPTYSLGLICFSWSTSNKNWSPLPKCGKCVPANIGVELLGWVAACLLGSGESMAPGNALQWAKPKYKRWWDWGGGGRAGFSPRQFQSPTCHAFPSGTQLFHDLFQILSISFN